MVLSEEKSVVSDDELVYRRVKQNEYSYENGILKIHSSAFNDKKQEPSVDRAKLNGYAPALTLYDKETDGVVSFLTAILRAERVNHNDSAYCLNVKPDPLPNNHAHAIIIPSPEYKNDTGFRKVRERLSRLASQNGWTLEPKVANN